MPCNPPRRAAPLIQPLLEARIQHADIPVHPAGATWASIGHRSLSAPTPAGLMRALGREASDPRISPLTITVDGFACPGTGCNPHFALTSRPWARPFGPEPHRPVSRRRKRRTRVRGRSGSSVVRSRFRKQGVVWAFPLLAGYPAIRQCPTAGNLWTGTRSAMEANSVSVKTSWRRNHLASCC